MPMNRLKIKQEMMIVGDSAKEKAISENEPKLRVEMEKNWSVEANNSPKPPPTAEISNDSPRINPMIGKSGSIRQVLKIDQIICAFDVKYVFFGRAVYNTIVRRRESRNL